MKRGVLHRMLALLLAAALLAGLPITAQATEVASGDWGDLHWTLEGTTLTVSGTGPMENLPVIQQKEAWTPYINQIETLVVESGVTSIGEMAFAGAAKLKRAALPAGLERIGGNAFADCHSLEQVQIPDAVTEIGYGAFAQCTALKEIDLPDCVTAIEPFAFAGCSSLERAKLPKYLENVPYNMFGDCTGLKSVTLPEKPKVIENRAFYKTQLTSIQLPESLTAIESDAFYGTAITTVRIPASVTTVGSGAFSGCENLKTIEVEAGNSAYKVVDGMLYTQVDPESGRNALVTCPASIGGAVTVSEPVEEVMEEAFSGCRKLTAVTLPACLTEMYPQSVFFGCSSLAAVYIAPDSARFESDNGVLLDRWYGSNSTLLCFCPTGFSGENGFYRIPERVTDISEGAFSGCTRLTEVVFPTMVETIGASVFSGCTNLRKVTLPVKADANPEPELPQGMFRNCSSLEQIYIPACFYKINTYAFDGCVNLQRIEVDPQSKQYSSDEAGVLYNKSMTVVQLCPQGKSGSYTVPSGVEDIGAGAFQSCKKLKEIILPDTMRLICRDAFSGCSSLKRVTVPATATQIAGNVFEGCDALRDLIILSRDCSVEGAWLGVEQTEIWCYEGSTVQAFAQENGQTYHLLDQETPPPTEPDPTEPTPTEPAPTEPKENPFMDLDAGRYYYEPVLWAVEHEITAGMDKTHFMPERSCTRGQVVTFLWRAMGCPEPKSTKCPFVDVAAGRFYYKAVLWAVENGITTGMDRTHFAPERTVTRGQFVTFLWRAEGEPEAAGSNPFTDVAQGRFYYDAVLWAAEHKITSGMTKTTFAPESSCTRGQVVTFLYRDLVQ